MVIFTVPVAVSAQQNQNESPPYSEEGWIRLLNGRDLSGWHAQDSTAENQWVITSAVHFDSINSPNLLIPEPTPGDHIVNGPDGKTVNLVSDDDFGDIELYVEFLMSKEPNASGIYLHGLYELQIFGSWDTDELKTSDCGAIYHRWIDEKPVGGSPPLTNACRPAGQWQSFHVWFRAPKFNASGDKIANAKFEKVLLNGVVVQENVEVEGGTRSHMSIPEAPLNPLLLQGNHKSIAFRNIYYRPFD